MEVEVLPQAHERGREAEGCKASKCLIAKRILWLLRQSSGEVGRMLSHEGECLAEAER